MWLWAPTSDRPVIGTLENPEMLISVESLDDLKEGDSFRWMKKIGKVTKLSRKHRKWAELGGRRCNCFCFRKKIREEVVEAVSLPVGWVEVTNNGPAYFYNETTGESVWEIPNWATKSFEKATSKSAKGTMNKRKKRAVDSVSEQFQILGRKMNTNGMNLKLQNASDKLQHAIRGSAITLTPDFDRRTAEKEVDSKKKVESAAKATSLASNPDTIASQDATDDVVDPLPEGWSEMTNEDGYTYYTHCDGRDSTWERPRSMPRSEDEPKPTTRTSSSVTRVTATPLTLPLPEGWRELVNDEGHVYYYHRVSDTATWARPQVNGI